MEEEEADDAKEGMTSGGGGIGSCPVLVLFALRRPPRLAWCCSALATLCPA